MMTLNKHRTMSKVHTPRGCDVANLEDIGKLEEAVADAAVVLIFLSSGYFASLNCQREVYAALANSKPTEAVIEADKEKGGELCSVL